jgi:hypothetical protein
MAVDDETMPSTIVMRVSGSSRKPASLYSQVSRALAELETQGLIACLNPEEKTGRAYALTGEGRRVSMLDRVYRF